MRILILGGSGLIGHKLGLELSKRFGTVYTTIRGKKCDFEKFSLFNHDHCIEGVDVRDFERLEGVLSAINPDVVLNCVGITKRKKEINEPLLAIGINSYFPHKLARWASEHGKRIIHFSTDCVFDGKLGNYTEESHTTAEDMYGRTKALGEINYRHTLTIRSSFIGREVMTQTELLEWFLSQKGKTIRGFTKAMYSGVSTIFMSKVVGNIIENFPDISGLKQLAIDNPISKYDLLCLAKEAFKVDVQILPDESFETKPTLNGGKLRDLIGLSIPPWKEMMYELAAETFYHS